ncbi:MAG: hypothetical protein AUK20_03255 [Parcubacteria group bacterium CG2_30_45_37]|nr:MAG: hypothetical protein AUK20_03255 [Parcubacteria group bacterium CG2_30_45_37]
MPDKILIINSSPEKNHLLKQAFKELARKNFSFRLWLSAKPWPEQFRNNNWPAKKIFLGPALNHWLKILFFLIAAPLLQLKCFFSLAKLKLKHQVGLAACLDLREKLIITAPARLLGLKVVWLESPDLNYRQINKILLALYKINARLAKLAVFTGYGKLQLINLGFPENNIILLPPGVKPTPYQENIFNKLASSGQARFRRKYFTVGVVTELNQRQKIETVFQAVKTCLPVIPNLQLIIVGEGRERKNLLWLAKKMGIENLVWLVGEQEQLKKWLDSFDIFLAAGENLKLDDYGNLLEAMAAGLPVLAPRNVGAEDFVMENKTGTLVEMNNNEMLARQIIKLHQDKRLRLHLGKNGRERVDQLFTLDKLVSRLEQILL